MDLTPDDVRALLDDNYPRHVRDAQFAQLSAARVPDDSIVLVLDEGLWDFDTDLGVSAHSMTLAMARRLYNELGAVIDRVEHLD